MVKRMNFEVGKEYRTKNGSRVCYAGLASHGHHFFRVLEGGHGIDRYGGGMVGETYTIHKSGVLWIERMPGVPVEPALAGMRLAMEWVNDDSDAPSEEEQMQRFCDRLGKAIAKKLLEMLKE